MSDIAAWLAAIGLQQYAEIFAENDIDLEVLPELSDQELNDLGLSLGHRKKLLKAAAKLVNDEPAVAVPITDTPTASSPPTAERRQLTVMFIDLVGSTALSGQLDPEDLRELMRRYQNVVAGEITRFKGYIAKYMGDGVLAYFGWPQAHEDEAERAVRVGLAVSSAVAKLATPAGEKLSARVGIATGLVVVGDVIGAGTAQEEAVVGETPNLAARLQGLAKPGTVLISDSTRRLLGEVFELQALGPQTLKGIADAVEVYRVCAERAIESRYQAQRSGVLPLFGREHELAQLLERWQQMLGGEGQMILLTAEAGIGKSRLLRAFSDALKGQPHYRISYQCSPYHSDSALYPTIRQLTRAAEIMAGDSTDTKLDKLEALLARALSEPQQSAPLIAALLGIDGSARYGALTLDPQQQRAQTLQTLLDQLVGLAQQQAVLFLLEDAHWIDPTTLELIEFCLNAISHRPVLLLITARPTFEHRFGGHPILTRLMLNRLDRASSLAIIRHLSGGKALPGDITDEIIHKADGIPLFVEELTKTVLSSSQLRQTESDYVLDGSLESLAIPSTLHDSLLARLDRMQPVRDVVQTAACIGREFSYALLAAVLGIDEQELQAALTQLVEAELIFRHGTPTAAHFTFKHALVRDAAYESLLKKNRRAIHARIGHVLQQQFAEIIAAQPELAAQHFSAADRHEAAVSYWLKAAQQAHQRFANKEAITHAQRGLAAVSAAGDFPDRKAQELELLMALAAGHRIVNGYAAREAEEALVHANRLADELGNIDYYVVTARILGGVYYVGGRFAEGMTWAERILAKASTPMQKFDGLYLTGAITPWLGRFAEAREALEQAQLLYDPTRTSIFAKQLDPYAHTNSYLGLVLTMMGYPEQGQQAHRDALHRAEVLQQPLSLGQAQMLAASSEMLLGMNVSDMLKSQLKVSQKHRIVFTETLALMQQGISLIRSGEFTSGIEIALDGLARYRACQSKLAIPFMVTYMADACCRAGQVEQGLALLQQARAEMDETGEDLYRSGLWRVQGELTLLRSPQDTEEAQACFQEALAVARQQQAKWLELQAALALSRLWLNIGKKQQARELLAPVYGWFTEGFEYADLKEAKALLDELA